MQHQPWWVHQLAELVGPFPHSLSHSEPPTLLKPDPLRISNHPTLDRQGRGSSHPRLQPGARRLTFLITSTAIFRYNGIKVLLELKEEGQRKPEWWTRPGRRRADAWNMNYSAPTKASSILQILSALADKIDVEHRKHSAKRHF